jgi:PUB domain
VFGIGISCSLRTNHMSQSLRGDADGGVPTEPIERTVCPDRVLPLAGTTVPLRLAPHVEEAHSALVSALHGTILQSHVNAPPKQMACVEALGKMVHNVIDNPGEAGEKYRRVRCTNEAFKTRVLAVKGGEEFLRAAGWREQTIEFTRHLVLQKPDDEVLQIAARLLDKCQQAVAEKAERHTRDQWLAKNEAQITKQSTLQAIADDKARRRDAAERAAQARRASQLAETEPSADGGGPQGPDSQTP